MSIYHSGFSDSVEAFVNSRKVSGAWNETVFGLNIRIFDHYCARHYPTEALRQEMVDIWCAKRETENVNSLAGYDTVTFMEEPFQFFLAERMGDTPLFHGRTAGTL